MESVVWAAVYLCLFADWSHSVNMYQSNSVDGQNCSRYIQQQTSRTNKRHNDDSSAGNSANGSKELECPPWYMQRQNSCEPGSGYEEVIYMNPGTGQPLLLPFYCMTTNESRTHHRDVLGGCLLTTNLPKLIHFFPLPCNVSKLNQFMCADFNREGQLCGKCSDGYAPPAYSYSLSCANCTDYSYKNWLKYSVIAFGPLTVFSAAIILLHVSATSQFLHGYILFCQLLSLPTLLRLFVNSHSYMRYENTRWFLNVYTSIVGIWNLDFFRLMYEPFCLHPHMTVVQSLTLDYLVALYPLLMVAVTLCLVSLYSRNCGIVVCLWKPLRRVLRPLSNNLDIRATLIESFSTLYLLSVVKIEAVSLDILLPTTLYYPDGQQSQHYYLYLAGDMRYFGDHHFLYALLALVLTVTLVLIPTLLLFLYPCLWFQRCLNRANCNSPALRTYMDVFQGHYKDGTGNTRDYRYFSGVFLLVRIVAMVQFPLMNSYFSVVMLGLGVTVLALTVAILHPQKSHTHYLLDSIFLSFVSVMLFSAIGDVMGAHNTIPVQALRGIGLLSALLPLIYFVWLMLYWVFWKKRILRKITAAVRGREFLGRRETSTEHTLLVSAVK